MFENGADIRLTGISKTFRSREQDVQALDGVDMELSRGKLYTIEGPSGSGKSTLLTIIGCLTRPDRGSLFFGKVDVAQWSYQQLTALRRDLVGHVYEQNNLLSSLSIVENYALILRITQNINRREAIEQGGAMLQTLGLSNLSHSKPSQISAGELKRSSIGRALIRRPEILLLDEPTANLDEKNVESVIEMITAYHVERQGTTIAVTHDPGLKKVADRRFQLRAGRIAAGE